MRNIILFITTNGIMLFSLFCLNGATLVTVNGTRYNDAEIINKLPDGIVLHYTNSNGFEDIKLIKFTELPPGLQKKLGYDTGSATSSDNNQKVTELKKEDMESARQMNFIRVEDEKNRKFDTAAAKIQKEKVSLTFKAISNISEGCVGWVKFNKDDSDDSARKICLLYNKLDPGLTWSGHLIPIKNRNAVYEGEKLQCYMTMNDAFTYFFEGEEAINKLYSQAPQTTGQVR